MTTHKQESGETRTALETATRLLALGLALGALAVLLTPFLNLVTP